MPIATEYVHQEPESAVLSVERKPRVREVEPPPIVRRRRTTIDDELVRQFAEMLSQSDAVGRWLSNVEPLPSSRIAHNRVAAYRKVLARQLGIDPSELRSRVWHEEQGYLFALSRMAR